MLRVKLEIIPFGDEEEAREIGRMDIFNKGYAGETSDLCNYGVICLDKGEEGLYSSEIQHFRKQGAWTLLRKILDTFKPSGP